MHVHLFKLQGTKDLGVGGAANGRWSDDVETESMGTGMRKCWDMANAYAPNWGPTIFQSAHEIASNTKLRESLAEIEAQAASEKAWWEKRRGQIQTEFIKELDQEEEDTAATDDGSKSGTKGSSVVSEDEAVMVDTPSKGGKN
ncbi:hypothetical protein NLG97_g4263 [Lecanicillium saksenae]|uniref:Uncharacterized protein n=1 Tax=Lecanicillium saksenae TaxID=468837 RepID=A0ACC1QXH6_9HYPO|nr:hypothetical protein NLG97_g4263 [Lecanicillium saksenae]